MKNEEEEEDHKEVKMENDEDEEDHEVKMENDEDEEDHELKIKSEEEEEEVLEASKNDDYKEVKEEIKSEAEEEEIEEEEEDHKKLKDKCSEEIKYEAEEEESEEEKEDHKKVNEELKEEEIKYEAENEESEEEKKEHKKVAVILKRITIVELESEEEKDHEEVKLESEEEKDHEEVTVESEEEEKNHKMVTVESEKEEEDDVEENGRRCLRKRLVKINYANTKGSDEESDEESEKGSEEGSEEGSSSSDEELELSDSSEDEWKKGLQQMTKKETYLAEKSEYEMMIDKKREEKMAFLQSLNINEAKEGLSEIFNEMKEKKKLTKKRPTSSERTSPPRKSGRLTNVTAVNLSEDVLYDKAISEAKAQMATPERTIENMPPELTFKEAIQEEKYESYMNDVNLQEPEEISELVYYKCDTVKELQKKQFKYFNDCYRRAGSLAWYPSVENRIAVTGNYDGEFMFWNIDSDSCPYFFKTHGDVVTHVQFHPSNHNQLLSTSKDGTMRCGDMVKQVFTEIYSDRKYSPLEWFDFVCDSTYIVAQRDGQAVHVDPRAKRGFAKKFFIQNIALTTVNVHPLKKDYFVAAGRQGMLSIWDLRRHARPLYNMSFPYQKAVGSAFFSPNTGESLLVTTADDSINIYDSRSFQYKLRLVRNRKYKMKNKKFKATWLPNSDGMFVIGSNDYPRRVQIFSENNIHNGFSLLHQDLNCITEINMFHPLVPALLCSGGKGTGKVFAFF